MTGTGSGDAASVVRPARWVAGAVLAVPLLLVPWLIHAVARVDPVHGARSWRPAGVAGDARSPRNRGSRRVGPAARLRLVAASAVLALLVVVPVAVLSVSGDDAPPPVPTMFEDVDWYPVYLEEINWALYSQNFEPTAAVRVTDVAGEYVNVEAGERRTWQPPDCSSCETLEVWLYGGSTTFGLGQRDDGTIASHLARAAWEDGLRLEVHNRGVGGDTHWEEAQRLAWDLAAGDEPDLVVFYDGTNEVMATRFGVDPNLQPSVIPAELWTEFKMRSGEAGSPPDGAAPPPEPDGAASAQDVGKAIAERYERARSLSAASARRHGVEVAWVWQPLAERRPPGIDEVPVEGRDWALERLESARAGLGEEVIDLSEILDDVEEPLFYDGIHTNERGAELVAGEMYRRLRPTIEASLVGAGAPGIESEDLGP